MATPEDVAQIGDFNSGVNLSGGKILMSQQSLDMPETGSVLEEMGCAGVPHHMRGDSKLEIGSLSIAVEALAHGMATHPFAQHRDEESRLSAIRSSARRANRFLHSIEVDKVPQRRGGIFAYHCK